MTKSNQELRSTRIDAMTSDDAIPLPAEQVRFSVLLSFLHACKEMNVSRCAVISFISLPSKLVSNDSFVAT